MPLMHAYPRVGTYIHVGNITGKLSGRLREVGFKYMSDPIHSRLIAEGADYWASWGSKGWTAVKVLQVKSKYAIVQRIDPLTNEVTTAEARVRLDEMVKRIPELGGTDKPVTGPADVFARVRRVRD